MCGAPSQGTAGLEAVDLTTATVIQGRVLKQGAPVPAAYVRLLDGGGEFTAEVQCSAEGRFRFFAAPGEWTIRALCAAGRAESRVSAQRGLNESDLLLA